MRCGLTCLCCSTFNRLRAGQLVFGLLRRLFMRWYSQAVSADVALPQLKVRGKGVSRLRMVYGPGLGSIPEARSHKRKKASA